jgi:hypothetical protein
MPSGTFVFDYVSLCRCHCEKSGIGTDCIDRMFR